MGEWPPISEPSLLARLAMGEGDFFAFLMSFARKVPRREFTEAVYERALGYPWARPEHSYRLTGSDVAPIDEMPGLGSEPRYPLLAIGSNGAPVTLAAKFADLPPEEQALTVITGDLHDFDIGPAALPTYYGALAGTLFASPGTAVRAALLWASVAQLTTLALTETSYYLGRLDGVHFEPQVLRADPVDRVYVFVSRLGSHCVDGAPVALAAVPATGRSAPAYTQEQLLDRVAGLVLSDGSSARDVVKLLTEDFGSTAPSWAPVLRDLTQPFESDRWTRFPASDAAKPA